MNDAVNSDGSVKELNGVSRPSNPLEKRMEVLAAVSAVDWVIGFSEQTPESLICELLPDLLVKGGDYKPEEVAGGQCVVANGGEVRILSMRDGCSTSNIIAAVKKDNN